VRIVYITGSIPFGFGDEFFIPEIEELMRQGHEVLIMQRHPQGALINDDVRELLPFAVRMPLFAWEVLAAAAAQSLRHPGRLLGVLRLLGRSRSAATLLKNLVVLPKGIWLAGAAKRWRADHIHAQWASTTATMALIASQWSGIPWSFTAHRGDVVENNLLALKADKAALARYISVVTRTMAQELGAGAGRPAVIHMGVVLPAETRPPAGRGGPLVLLCPGNMVPVKGHKYLIEAMAILRRAGVACQLRLAGSGPLENELRRQVEAQSLGSSVEFRAQVSHSVLLGWYRNGEIDAVVLPSVDLGNHLHEGIPVSLMEAMAHGVPAISTATGGIAELVGEGAGVLVPPQDPAALAEAVERLARDPQLRARLGAAGRKRIEEAFAVEGVVSQLVAKLEAACAGSRAVPHESLADQ
jgi:glycosyltransferase involved in cell wall biosynthesis